MDHYVGIVVSLERSSVCVVDATGRILREAEAGTEFTVTVNGRPVARVVPLHEKPPPRVDVPWNEAIERLSAIRDEKWLAELLQMREEMAPETDPWGDG